MNKKCFIMTLMLGVSFATIAKAADTSYDHCIAAVGAANCIKIGDSNTYYALSGTENNKTMTIYGTTESSSSAATVPGSAFYGKINSKWQSTLPTGVTSLKTSGSVNIESYAFYGATGLTSVDLTGVQTIGISAFFGATGLTSADLTGVKSIGTGAFENATGLTSVDLTGVQTIGGRAFSRATGLTSVDLTGVQTIEKGAFSNATSLIDVNLTNVGTIKSQAFYGATSLTNIDLTGVGEIEELAFDGTTNLKNIVLPDSLFDQSGTPNISAFAFERSSVEKIYCPNGRNCASYFKTCDSNAYDSYYDGDGVCWSDTIDDEVNPVSYSAKVISYSIENGQIKLDNGKKYASFDDLLNGNHIKKRIYTIDEANQVAGPINRVSIKYR